MNLHQKGQLGEAERLYRSILTAQPTQPDANHNLGVLAVQRGQVGAALPHFKAALAAKPQQAQFWLSYIETLIQADMTDAARQVLEAGRQHGLQGAQIDAVAARLGYAQEPGRQEIDELLNLYNQGKIADVITRAEALTQRYPNHGLGWKMLGYILHLQGQMSDSAVLLQRAAECSPNDVEVHNLRGNVLLGLGRVNEAENSYRQAAAVNPKYAETYSNLGNVLRILGKFQDAETSCRQAIKLRPDFVEAHVNLGNVLYDVKQFEAAADSFRQALSLRPDFAEAHNSLGAAYRELGRFEEAIACFRRAVQIKPGYAEAHNNLANLLVERGQFEEAAECVRKALEAKPDFAEAYTTRLNCLNHSDSIAPEALFAEYARFGAQFETPLKPSWPQHGNSREPERRLRVGFVSGDLRNHAVANYIEPLLPFLARSDGLRLYAYSNYATEDTASQRMRRHFAEWNSVVGLSDAAFAEKIQADGIDILIDLSGHTALHRLLTFARKPAPIQASWIGYPGTTGLCAMDYYLSDRYFLPPGQFDAQFTEKIVHMPAGAPFLPHEAAPPVNALPALSNRFLTFGSFNQMRKLGKPVIALWAQLLRAIPDARMFLGGMPEDGKVDTLIELFASEGIARERLTFHPRSGMAAYLGLHHQVDICLDTFPYNGGTTTLHAIWMGVPTLTVAGRTPAGRSGPAILGHAGLADFIAEDAADFVQKGVVWTGQLERLAELRAGLRERFRQSAMSQPALIAAGAECALRVMWKRWCAGLPPASFEVSREEAEMARPDQAPPIKQRRVNPSNVGGAPDERETAELFRLYQQGPVAELIPYAESLTRRYPAHGLAWKILGHVLQGQGKLNDAAILLQKAAACAPDDVEAHNLLGNVMFASGDYAAAEAHYRRAVQANPAFADAHSNLGNALCNLGKYEEAAASSRQAIRLKPGLAEAHANLANALREMKDFEASIESFRRTVELRPDLSKAHNNLGTLLRDLGRFDEAAHCFREALKIDPDFAAFHSNLLYTQVFQPDLPQTEIASALREFDRRFGLPYRADWKEFANTKDGNRRLKVGYVSADFRAHAVARFFEPILAAHDRSAFEVFCYYNHRQNDAVTSHIQSLADHWIACSEWSDAQLAERIRSDGIDTLIDLSGHTSGNRLPVFARKPAPVQMTYLGYPGTSGLSAIDYRLTDAHADPEGAEQYYSEELLRLPDSLCCYQPLPNMPDVTPLPALANGYVTFGSLNNANKIDHATIALWARILKALPTSRLLMLTVQEGKRREQIAAQFEQEGVASSRIDFCGSMPGQQFHAMLGKADIALDPLLVTGGTTTCETLWMGVPVVVLKGQRFIHRVGYSFLHSAGLPQYAADTEDEYVRIATEAAAHPAELARLRDGLRAQMAASALVDNKKFVRNFERVLRVAWQRWCGGRTDNAFRIQMERK